MALRVEVVLCFLSLPVGLEVNATCFQYEVEAAAHVQRLAVVIFRLAGGLLQLSQDGTTLVQAADRSVQSGRGEKQGKGKGKAGEREGKSRGKGRAKQGKGKGKAG